MEVVSHGKWGNGNNLTHYTPGMWAIFPRPVQNIQQRNNDHGKANTKKNLQFITPTKDMFELSRGLSSGNFLRSGLHSPTLSVYSARVKHLSPGTAHYFSLSLLLLRVPLGSTFHVPQSCRKPRLRRKVSFRAPRSLALAFSSSVSRPKGIKAYCKSRKVSPPDCTSSCIESVNSLPDLSQIRGNFFCR